MFLRFARVYTTRAKREHVHVFCCASQEKKKKKGIHGGRISCDLDPEAFQRFLTLLQTRWIRRRLFAFLLHMYICTTRVGQQGAHM